MLKMNIQFLISAKEKGLIPQTEERKFHEELNTLSKSAKSDGLLVDAQKVVIDVALNVNLNDRTFKNLILCLIPRKKISKGIIDDVLCWSLIHSSEKSFENRVSWLLDWIACLLDHKMIEKESLDQYYSLLFFDIKKNRKSLSYILYLLTKPEDVTRCRINFLQDWIIQLQEPPHLCVLLKRFKELNPNFVYQTVRVNKTIEQVFCEKNKIYEHVKDCLSRRNITYTSSSMSVIPFTNHKKMINNSQDIILPPVQYLQQDIQSQILDECHVDDIKNGKDLVNNFHKLSLPLNTLSLLNSSTGISVLMMSPHPVQEHFFQNLHYLLEENLIRKRSNYSISEVESLLENVIRLQQIFDQGFLSVSRVLSVFLQFWDGFQYRSQIFKILESFVFKFHAELNRFVLLPLHTLFVTGQSEEQSSIILYFLNLIRNMYSRLRKVTQNLRNVFEEPTVLNSQEELISVVKSLTKFTCELIKLALYTHPCDNQIVFVSLIFYEQIQELEVRYNMPWWTIISSNVVYHCLFSFNAELLNRMCGLWLRYKEVPVARMLDEGSIVELNDKQEERLSHFAGDLFNILWAGQALRGHIFSGLTSFDERYWKSYVNLNDSLTIERHVMFSPYRMLHASKTKKVWNLLSKEEVLILLKDHFPYFYDVLQKMLSITDNGEEGEDSRVSEMDDSIII